MDTIIRPYPHPVMRIRKAAVRLLGGVALAVAGLSFQSCHTPKDVTYFQDTHH